MAFNVSVTNNTLGAIVVNGKLSTQGENVRLTSCDEVITQIPNQGVVQLDSEEDNMVSVTSSYYRNEFQRDGTSYVYLSINEDFTFSITDTPIQNVPLQTNRIAQFPFLPLASEDLPSPWSVVQEANAMLVNSLNSKELNFTKNSQGQVNTNASLFNVNVSKSVQIQCQLQVKDPPETSNLTDGIYLPGGFYLRFSTNGHSDYYYNGQWVGGSSICSGTSEWYDITIIIFPNNYVLIENGVPKVNRDFEMDNPNVVFGCVATEANQIDFTFADIEVGTPLSLTEQTYDFSGAGNIWSDNYLYNTSYNSTNWVRCDNLIATIYSNVPDDSQKQILFVMDVNTGDVVVEKEVEHSGTASRSPFVDEDLKYICFPINNRYYYVYDINQGLFIRENIDLNDDLETYSEEVCHLGVIYFLRYDNNWYIYDIINNEKNTVDAEIYHSRRRIVKPIIYNNVIFAAMYTHHDKKDYTEVIAFDIENDSLKSKWHYDHKGCHIWSYSITCDNDNLYYWNMDIELYAINLESGQNSWINSDYCNDCDDIGFKFAPITNQMGAIHIVTDAGEIIALSPDNGKTIGTSEKPFMGKTYSIGETFLDDFIKIYPDGDRTPVNLWSHPKIVNGHLTFQGKTSKALYSVNLDTGIIQKTTIEDNCYANNFSANLMTKCFNQQAVNLMQMQQYDKNFYFDAALMADQYERDPKTATVRPKATDNSFYTVTASIQDNQGIPIDNIVYMKNMGEKVTIISPLFETEHGEITLEPTEQVAFKPGIDGKFKFKIPATSLYCPTLHFWSDFMLPNVRIAFFPNQSNVDVLRKQQSQDVLSAKNYEGEDVFEEKYQNESDANAIVQMIGNSVGGSILDEDTPAQSSKMIKKDFKVKSILDKAQIKKEKSNKIQRRIKLKQELLTTQDYQPNLTMDYCAFADDNTDNCLCTNDPQSPVIDQPYLEDPSTYTSGEFVIVDDHLVGPSQNIKYDPDPEKVKWNKVNASYRQQLDQFLTKNPNVTRQEAEEDIYGFPGFVKDCIKGDDPVYLYHWEPQDEGLVMGLGFKKLFRVVIKTANKIYQFIVNTIEKGLQVLQSFFARVAQSIQSVIQWLSWVLNWQDILNCQKNLQDCIINNFQKGLEQFNVNQEAWIAKVDEVVENARDNLDSIFDTAQTALGGYNMDDVTQDYRNPRSLTGEGGDNITNQMNYLNDQIGLPSSQAELRQFRNMQYKYVKSKNMNGIAVLSPEQFHPKLFQMVQSQESTKKQDGLLALLEAIQTEIEQYAHLLTNLLDQFKGQIDNDIFQAIKEKVETILFAFKTKVNTPQQFFQTCMVVVLDLIKSFADLALDATGLIMTDMIKLIPKVINSLIKIMMKPIRIPGITTLWEFIVGEDEPLTILSFISLLIALPMTLTMKLLGYKDSIFFEENGVLRYYQQGKTLVGSEKSIKIGTAIGAGVAALFYGALDTFIDASEFDPLPGTPPLDLAYKISILFFDAAVVGLTFPNFIEPLKIYFLDFFAWVLGAFHTLLEIGIFIASFTSFRLSTEEEAWFEFGYGVCFDLLCLGAVIGKWDLAPKFGSKDDAMYLFWHCIAYSVPELAKPLRIYKNPKALAGLIALDGFFGLANASMFTYYAVKAENPDEPSDSISK